MTLEDIAKIEEGQSIYRPHYPGSTTGYYVRGAVLTYKDGTREFHGYSGERPVKL